MIHFLLGVSAESPLPLLERYRKGLADRSLPVAELAKGEVLSMNPDAYERFVAGGGKPRRASAEAALLLSPRPRMGDRVAYYITPKQKGRTSDWQRARPVALYDPVAAPYDPEHYTEKLDDWLERYGKFLGISRAGRARADRAPLGFLAGAASTPVAPEGSTRRPCGGPPPSRSSRRHCPRCAR